MRHDICYRDDEEGKYVMMLQELDELQRRGFREKIDKKLVQSIIGKKRRMRWGIEWSNELSDE